MRDAPYAWLVVLCLGLAVTSLVPMRATANSVLAVAAVDASSDASGALTVDQNLTWVHAPAAAPTLATLSCAVHQTGVGLSASYGGTRMNTSVTLQQSNQFVGLFTLRNPAPGSQTVWVTLTATAGLADVQCSATTWTGVVGVDLSVANTSYDLSGGATSLTIGPRSPVSSNEVFFAAVHRYMPQGAPALSVYPANASIVDSNTSMGTGAGFGCQPVTFALWEDCIGTAQLAGGGTSMTFSWTTNGYALAAGIGLFKGTPPAQGGSVESTILGLSITSFVFLVLVVGIGVAAVAAASLASRGPRRPPSGNR